MKLSIVFIIISFSGISIASEEQRRNAYLYSLYTICHQKLQNDIYCRAQNGDEQSIRTLNRFFRSIHYAISEMPNFWIDDHDIPTFKQLGCLTESGIFNPDIIEAFKKNSNVAQ